MLSYDPTLSHHLEACPEAPSLQMGQPADRLLQRQQTDNLPQGRRRWADDFSPANGWLRSKAMSVLTLHIRPEGAQQYLARVFDGKILVGVPTLHPGIKEAIEAYGLGQGFAGVKQNEINRNCVETPSTGSVGTIRVMFNTVHERTAP